MGNRFMNITHSCQRSLEKDWMKTILVEQSSKLSYHYSKDLGTAYRHPADAPKAKEFCTSIGLVGEQVIAKFEDGQEMVITGEDAETWKNGQIYSQQKSVDMGNQAC